MIGNSKVVMPTIVEDGKYHPDITGKLNAFYMRQMAQHIVIVSEQDKYYLPWIRSTIVLFLGLLDRQRKSHEVDKDYRILDGNKYLMHHLQQ